MKKMKLTINGIYKMIYILLLFCVLILKWYNNSSLIKYLGLFSLIFILVNIKKREIKKNVIFATLIFIIYLSINLFFTSQHTYFIDEVLKFIAPQIGILVFLDSYSKSKDDNLKKTILKTTFTIGNIYMVINSIIMIKQLNYSYYMMRNFEGNTFYADHITGLLGASGTHRLCLFYLVIIFVNFYFLKSENKFQKILAYIMLIFTLAFSLYFSTLNDNRAYYFLLMIFLVPIIYKSLIEMYYSKKKLFKIVLGALIIGLITFATYNYNSTFKEFIDVEIIEKVYARTNRNMKSSTSKSEERIELLNYALENGNGYSIGKGIGAVQIISDPSMPRHFGISEITSRVYNGGLIYFFLLLYLFYVLICSMTGITRKSLKVFIFFSLLILAAYQQIFSICEETFLIGILYCLIGYIFKEGDKHEIK